MCCRPGHEVEVDYIFMQTRTAVQPVITQPVLGARHITDIKIVSINAAAGEVIVQVRVGKACRKQKVFLKPAFAKSVDIEQVIRGSLSVCDLILNDLAG